MIHIDNRKEIGKTIRELRQAKHMSLEKLGEILGLEGQSIGNIERGITALSIDHVAPLCEYFGITPNVLLGYKGRTAEEIFKVCSVKEKMEMDRIIEVIYTEFRKNDNGK